MVGTALGVAAVVGGATVVVEVTTGLLVAIKDAVNGEGGKAVDQAVGAVLSPFVTLWCAGAALGCAAVRLGAAARSRIYGQLTEPAEEVLPPANANGRRRQTA